MNCSVLSSGIWLIPRAFARLLFSDKALLLLIVACSEMDSVWAGRVLSYEQLISRPNDTNLINRANGLAQHYVNLQMYDSAFFFAKAAYNNSEKSNYHKGQAYACLNMAKSYNGYTLFDKSIRYLMLSRKLFEQMGDLRGVNICEMETGIIYYTQKKYREANQAFNEALGQAFLLKDSLLTAKFYYLSGLTLTELKAYNQAESHLLRASELFYKLGKAKRYWECKTGLADLYLRTGKMAASEQLYNEAVNYFREIKETEGISVCYLGLGKIANYRKDTALAISKIEEAFTLAAQVNFFLVAEPAALLLSELYIRTGNSKAAYQYQKQYYTLREKIMSSENTRAILSIQSELELSRKQAEIDELDRRRQQARSTSIAMLIIGLLLCGLVYHIYKRFRAERKSKFVLDRERKRSEELLLNILPVHTAEELKSNGKAKPKFHQNVTVLFADIVDFTKRAEQLSPEELVDELDYCFSKLDAIIDRHGLEKIKTIGDAYMCAGGLTPESGVGHVVDAAIEIMAFIEQWQNQADRVNGNPLQLRIGINTGPVVAGVVGFRKFAYDIWGDTVNLAARLQQHGDPGKIVVSEATHAQIHTAYNCSYRGEVNAKNKGQVKMYYVEGRKTPAGIAISPV